MRRDNTKILTKTSLSPLCVKWTVLKLRREISVIRKQPTLVWEGTAEIPYWWHGCHYPDLGSVSALLKQIFLAAWSVRILVPRSGLCTSSVWNNVFVPQTSFSGGTIAGSQKCQLFSKANRRYACLQYFLKGLQKGLIFTASFPW